MTYNVFGGTLNLAQSQGVATYVEDRPDTPLWEIWTRRHSVCCVASRYLLHRGCRFQTAEILK